MASIRQQVLDAFFRLEKRTQLTVFRLRDVVAEVLNSNPQLTEQTVRTYVTSVMCANAPVHHANHTNDLLRVERGMYRRMFDGDVSESDSHTPVAYSAEWTSVSESPDPDWYWEGHVQASVISGLATTGWRVLAVADTQSRAAGTDIVAETDGKKLHVEVKGYPSSTYARGDRKGQPKPTYPATQARHWFAGALMKAAMLRGDHPDDHVAMGLPAFETYSSLVGRVADTLAASSIDVIWVDQTGEITFESPGVDKE